MAGAADDDGLKVNDLARFSKRSDRLVLEEFSHCEVPAGCGGVVFRWRDPAEGVPVSLRVAAPASVTGFIDGRALSSARATLAAGPHRLGLRLLREGDGPPLFACCLEVYVPDHTFTEPRAGVIAATSAAGAWLSSTTDPGEGWAEPGRGVPRDARPLAAAEVDLEQLPSQIKWRYSSIVRLGGALLGLPEARELWIWTDFRVELEMDPRGRR